MPTTNISLTPEQDALRIQIEAGVNALDRGDFIELDETELEGYFEGLRTRRFHGAFTGGPD